MELLMKASRITSTAALALLLGLVAAAWAGQERPADKQDHPKQENTRQQAKPAQEHEQPQSTAGQGQRADGSRSHVQHQQQAAQQQRATVSRQEEHTRQQRSAAPAQNRPAKQRVQQSAWQEHRAQNWQ